MANKIVTHRDLQVYSKAMDVAMAVFFCTQQFPREEAYSLTDQLRRSSRSVCANIAEAWRKRRYEKAFISKLSDAEGEAAEAQVWIEFAVKCSYLPREEGRRLYGEYDEIVRMLVDMIVHAAQWTIGSTDRTLREESETYGDLF